MMLADFLHQATRWAEERPEIVGLALVGSHARNDARPDSDVDLVILCTSPSDLLRAQEWARCFGQVRHAQTEIYGAVHSLRVSYTDGMEVEFGVAYPAWASVPLDRGTRRVLRDGVRMLYDPLGLLDGAARAASAA